MAHRSDRDFVVLTSDDCDQWKQQNFKKSDTSVELEHSRRIVLNILPKVRKTQKSDKFNYFWLIRFCGKNAYSDFMT